MNVLEVQGLTKRYPAFTLNGVSFDVPQGAVMVLSAVTAQARAPR